MLTLDEVLLVVLVEPNPRRLDALAFVFLADDLDLAWSLMEVTP